MKNAMKYKKRAANGARTRDPQLGKLMLYQLSYIRISDGGIIAQKAPSGKRGLPCGRGCAQAEGDPEWPQAVGRPMER